MRRLRKGDSRSRAALMAALLTQLACGGGEAARGRLVTLGHSAQGLGTGELESVNGSYEAECRDRSGEWSLGVGSDDELVNELSVLHGNAACVLTITSLQTNDDLFTADPPIVLSGSFNGSTFGDPLEFYAAARLDDPTFAGDFVLTVLFSDDPGLGIDDNEAIPQPPTVIENTPADDAMNVTIAQRPTATFSVDMDADTVDESSFIVQRGMTPVPGVVSYDDATNTATFTPDAALALGALHEVTITSGAENVRNTPLGSSHSWTFTTAADSQGPVYLRSASTFVVLGGSTVTNTGTTSITGDVGVSPGAAIDGLAGLVDGSVHAGDATAAEAQLDLATAHDEAAARILGAVPMAAELGETTLTPGLYTFDSSAALSTGNLTLDADGQVDAVFLFQIPSTLTTSLSRQVILIDGAKASNVYWQVGSSATLGTTTAFVGTILAATSITIETGASLNGRALAEGGAVTLDTNDIDRPTP